MDVSLAVMFGKSNLSDQAQLLSAAIGVAEGDGCKIPKGFQNMGLGRLGLLIYGLCNPNLRFATRFSLQENI